MHYYKAQRILACSELNDPFLQYHCCLWFRLTCDVTMDINNVMDLNDINKIFICLYKFIS